MFSVYKVTNKENGKGYVGITGREVSVRFNEHLSRADSVRNSRIYSALRKYGKENFSVETIYMTGDEDHVREMESYFITEHDTYNSGYNANLGGCGFLVFPEHIKQKISAAQKGKHIPRSVRKKMSDAKTGDPRCALHLGEYTAKGASNPKAKRYLVRHPNGRTETIKGMRAFCRKHGINQSAMTSKKKSHGFEVLRTFNDYLERE